ncbi:MAG: polyprenyl synthetase family protein [Gemmataceae bacterium]
MTFLDSSAAPPHPASHANGLVYGPVLRDLDETEKIFRQTLASKHPDISRLVEQLQHYRGKRLRPLLLLLSAKACGEIRHAHHVLGAVVEMIHTATLVHDDVLDEAGVRRHVATVNAGWGNKTSILLGDYLFTHAFHLTSSLGEAEACRLIGEATNRVCDGELRQTLERRNLELGETDYLEMIEGKTAALTACCCRLGGLYAGAKTEVVEALANYGRLLGMAFQVADDLLDVVGSEQKAGKTLGTDLEQQKLTLPLIYLFDRVPATEAERLRGILQTPGAQKSFVIKPLLESTHALRDARRRAEEFARDAVAELAVLPNSPCREILKTLTTWAVSREL